MPRRLTLVLGALMLLAARPNPPNVYVSDADGSWTQFDGGIGGRKPRSVITPQNVAQLPAEWQGVLPETCDSSPVFVKAVEAPRGLRDLPVVNTTAGPATAVDATTRHASRRTC